MSVHCLKLLLLLRAGICAMRITDSHHMIIIIKDLNSYQHNIRRWQTSKWKLVS